MVTADAPEPPGRSRDETRADLKQVVWALLLVYPFIAVAAYFARVLIGDRAAIWLFVGLAAFVTLAFALVVGFSVLASYAEGSAGWFNRRARRTTKRPTA
jgi:hypothetical protein